MLHSINNDIFSKYKIGKCNATHSLSAVNVQAAIKRLKAGKSDGLSNYSTNHILNGGDRLHVLIALLFSSMLTHGFTPSDLAHSKNIRIPKDKRKSLNMSNNYRGIAISSVLGKVFDWVIIQSENLSSSDYQFGFKQAHSTTQCFLFLMNVSITIIEMVPMFTVHSWMPVKPSIK